MCGVPYHAAEIYLQRLLRKGYRIALCEQMEDPKTVKGIVKREVTRVLTPGTAVDPALGAGESCWLASVAGGGTGVRRVGVALLDLSTGEFRATEFAGADAWALALDELGADAAGGAGVCAGWAGAGGAGRRACAAACCAMTTQELRKMRQALDGIRHARRRWRTGCSPRTMRCRCCGSSSGCMSLDGHGAGRA